MERTTVSSGTEWEEHVGYSRAVRAGDQVHVSGTTPVDDEGSVVGETPYEQTVAALEIIEGALEEAGASLADVRPAATMVEVSRLVGEEFAVEVEATAVVTE